MVVHERDVVVSDDMNEIELLIFKMFESGVEAVAESVYAVKVATELDESKRPTFVIDLISLRDEIGEATLARIAPLMKSIAFIIRWPVKAAIFYKFATKEWDHDGSED